jgi:hypothetical protein
MPHQEKEPYMPTRTLSTSALIRVLLFILLAASSAFAQTNTTALTGTVSDASGLRLPGSSVTLVNTATGAKTSLQTQAQGEFSFAQILPGHYDVTVHHDGFNDNVQSVDLYIATPMALAVKLAVGTSASVSVEADIPSTLNQVDASLGKAFNNQQISTLPYLANNTLSLLALQPGVLSFDASNTYDPRAGTINGARQDQTNVTLDGVDNNDANYGDAFTGVLRSTRDSLEEFRVTTSGANADSGRSSGAQVALQTKSGTNNLHGSAYYYYRDPAAASNSWFYKQSQLNSNLPDISAKVLQDTYGGTLGLPIIKNKLFFFGAYEGFKQASDSVVTQEVPLGTGNSTDYGIAPGIRNGTLTYLNTTGGYTTLTPAQIAAMDNTCTAGGGCPNGPGDNAAIAAYYKQYPLSNGTTVGDGHNSGGFTFVSPSPISNITNIVRMDYNLNSKQSLFVRGNLQSDNQAATSQFPGQLPTSNTYGNSRGVAAGHIWAINGHLTNNARYGWTRYGNNIQGGLNSNYITFATANGALTPLNPTTSSTMLIENTNNFADDLSFTKGRHSIQFGGNDRLIYNSRLLNLYKFISATVSSGTTAAGIANKGQGLDASAAGYPTIATSFNTSYDFAASELTGLITGASEYQNYSVTGNSLVPLPIGTLPTHHFKNFEQEYYVQDQFRVTPKLTLTAGIRYVYLGVPYETHGQEVKLNIGPREFMLTRAADMAQGISYNPVLEMLPAGKANNLPDYWTPGKLDFAPRVAFNYSPDGKTSIRGGFMLAYDHFGMAVVDVQNDNGSYGLNSLYVSLPNLTVGTAPRFTSATAPPTQIIPTPPSGNIPFPFVLPNSTGIQAVDDTLRAPYAEVFNLSVQRELHRGLTVTATYTGRLGRHVLSPADNSEAENLYDPASGMTWYQAAQIMDKAKDAGLSVANFPNIPYLQNIFPNASYTDPVSHVVYHGTQGVYGQLTRGADAMSLYTLDLNAANSAGGALKNRFYHPQVTTDLLTESSIAVSNYNALQLSVRHTLTRNFIYDFNYAYAHSIDEGSEPERGAGTTSNTFATGAPAVITSAFNPSGTYASSDFDIRHLITADWTLALPYGHGQHFGANSGKLLNEVLGGWNLNGIAKYSSALPWGALAAAGASTDYQFRSWDVAIAPVQNSGHHTYLKSATGVLTPNAFGNGNAAYASLRQAYAGEVGERNYFRADGYFSVDPGISKSFSTFEGQSFKLTVEVFNVTNAVRYGLPPTGNNGRSGSPSFGNYTSLLNSPRQMQFSGRYYF